MKQQWSKFAQAASPDRPGVQTAFVNAEGVFDLMFVEHFRGVFRARKHRVFVAGSVPEHIQLGIRAFGIGQNSFEFFGKILPRRGTEHAQRAEQIQMPETNRKAAPSTVLACRQRSADRQHSSRA